MITVRNTASALLGVASFNAAAFNTPVLSVQSTVHNKRPAKVPRTEQRRAQVLDEAQISRVLAHVVTASSELTGGAGFTFEDRVAAQYLAALLCEGGAPGIKDRIVTRVATQQEAFGEPLDDLVIDFRGTDQSEARLSLQVKRSLVVSSTRTNTDFRAVVRQSWTTINHPGFREDTDRCGGATDFIAVGKYRTLIDLGAAARASETLAHFEQRFDRGGNASAAVKTVRKDIQILLDEVAGRPVTPGELHRFLRHFIILEFDYQHEAATGPSGAIHALAAAIVAAEADRAPFVWDRLCTLAREGAGRSAEFFRATLVRYLSPLLTLQGSRALRADIRQVDEPVDRTKQMIRRHMPFQAEVVEQRLLRHRPLAHHRPVSACP